jgi:two-component system, sensor histidine kinase and response regulator
MRATNLSRSDHGSPGARQAARILVVEDERIVALDLAATLRRLGYRVEGPVDTGECAVATARTTRPDLVLMDIRLRGALDGVAAAALIGEQSDAPVVFLTAHSDSETLQRAKSASPYSYLIKPFRQDDLRCAIEVSLHRHAVELRLRERERDVERLNTELERRVMERTAELEAANRELEAFSYSVAHDLRAPLRGIDGFTQLALERQASTLDDEARAYLQRVRAAAQRMSRLIDDLLELAHVVRSDFEREQVDLSALAAEIDLELRAAQPERKVDFVNQTGVSVNGDPTLLRVALYNLLSNAWKFTASSTNARIEFGARRENGRPICFVRDNGVGFDMNNAGQLFGVFQRLHHVRDFPGNGIGLAIVQRAVQRHGGRVWAEAAPGVGATFWFSLGDHHESFAL